MASWSKSVYSSRVTTVAWNEDTRMIEVTWAKGGKVSAYGPASEEVALNLANAASVGIMINQEIIPNYPHRYIS